jgi:uncharacterized protein with ATP-grasp and redox domains
MPCFISQALTAVRSLSDDETIHENVLREVLRIASETDMHEAPPLMGQKIHRIIREVTGNSDPYMHEKVKYNSLASSLLPELREKLKESAHPFSLAIRLSIAGNIIDFGTGSGVNEEDVRSCIKNSKNAPIDINAVNELYGCIKKSQKILYLGDNSGEIAFDRLFIEQMPYEKITFVVRGHPVINDVTMQDAEQIGMNDLVNVIDNGSDAPGTILSDCSGGFRERFESADLIIAKGQGNYESLSEVDKKVFFLLQAKCPIIARDIGCQVGDFIIKAKTI